MSSINRTATHRGRHLLSAAAKIALVFAVLMRFTDIGVLSAQSLGDTKPTHWTRMYDFDGDGKNDEIMVDFTGGAHCCYRLTVRLSLTGKAHRLPVFLDGGYVGAEDLLSKPERFSIHKTDDALPKLLMHVNTYNGEPYPLPKTWKRRFKLKTNFIAVGFPHGRLQVRNWLPRQ